MLVESRDSAAERRTIIWCITSKDFLSRLIGKLDGEPFRSKYANLLYGFCDKHYRKYRDAPCNKIESIFEKWSMVSGDKDMIATVGRLLSSLSQEYERQDSESDLHYALDTAESLFNTVKLERLQEGIRDKLEKGMVEGALADHGSFQRINLCSPPFIDILEDEEEQRASLESRAKALFRYPGAAGDFFGDEFAEDSFIAFLAPPKGRKSFTLQDVAWRAMRCGNKVAYFQIGDLSKNQVMCRFHQRAAYRPIKAKTILLPTGIVVPQGHRELAIVEREDRSYENVLDWEEARRAYKLICKKHKGRIRLSYHPTSSVSVQDLQGILAEWDRDDWKATVVVIDYAGNLAPVDRKMDPVHQVSYSWALMRQISEMRRCCVVTAQQSNSEGFKAWCLTRRNFSESKMILAHVTAFCGINCTEEEDSHGIVRYNFVVRRADGALGSKCLYTASCLDVCNPVVVSFLP